MRRIALVIPTMDRGGAEKQVSMLAAALPRDRFDVHVVLLTRGGPLEQPLRDAGIPVTQVGKRFKADPSAYFRLRALLRRLRPDLVHTFLFAANSYARAAARNVGVPRVVGSERCVDLWKTEGHFWVDRYLARRSDAITTNSSAVRDFYAQHGIPPSLFRVIPNGIAPRQLESIDRREACRRLGVPEDRRLIAAVGRLWPQKRYRDLIWAAELLATLRGDTVLVVFGDGPQRGELLRHRDAVTAAERVRLVGHRDDAAALLPHFDLYWSASAYEGQSNALMEAMQIGLPVVVSDIPGNRDLVEPGRSGRVVELGDAADFARQSHHLLEHPEEARDLGRAAQQRIAEQFSERQMIDRHAALYEELIG